VVANQNAAGSYGSGSTPAAPSAPAPPPPSFWVKTGADWTQLGSPIHTGWSIITLEGRAVIGPGDVPAWLTLTPDSSSLTVNFPGGSFETNSFLMMQLQGGLRSLGSGGHWSPAIGARQSNFGGLSNVSFTTHMDVNPLTRNPRLIHTMTSQTPIVGDQDLELGTRIVIEAADFQRKPSTVRWHYPLRALAGAPYGMSEDAMWGLYRSAVPLSVPRAAPQVAPIELGSVRVPSFSTSWHMQQFRTSLRGT
jgi:hypothetical protein